MEIFSAIKFIFDLIAYSALIIIIFAFIYVRRGGEIDLRWDPEDDDYEDYDGEEEEEEEESNENSNENDEEIKI